MTIVDALMDGELDRISKGDRWMFWDDMNMEWVVLERPKHKKTNTVLAYTDDEEVAVAALIKE